jgi:site-specific recombinase XerD
MANNNKTETRWATAIDSFGTHQREQGLAETTVDRQLRILRRVARELQTSPGQVTTAQLEQRYAAHPAGHRTIKTEQLTLRAFYRWAIAERIATAAPLPAPKPITRYRVDRRWQDAIQDFEIAQGRRKIADATIAQRVKHLTRLAADAERGPWEVSAAELRGWLESLPGVERTRLAHRVSLRAFYRWAHANQLVAEDPTDYDTQHHLRLGVPAPWAPELAAYIRSQRAEGRPRSTLETRRLHLEKFARDHSRQHPYEITLDDLLEWFGAKRWASETRRGYRGTLVSFYRWAESTARTQENPAAELPRVRASQPRPRPALEHEVDKALAMATPRERLAVRLAAQLGLRRAEVAQVHSSDLLRLSGDEQWWLRVHGKGRKERRVPLTHDLSDSLRALPEGYAFPGKAGGHITPAHIGKIVARLLPEGVTMHALRHRFATRAYSIDRDVFAVQQLLGHASPNTTQRYVEVPDHDLRRLVQAVGA